MRLLFSPQVSKGRGLLNGFLRFFSICLANLMGNASFSQSRLTENSDYFAFEFVANPKVEKGDNVVY